VARASFSRAVLGSHLEHLGVLPLPRVTWCDLGSPRRVLLVLARMRVRPAWAHLAEAPVPPPRVAIASRLHAARQAGRLADRVSEDQQAHRQAGAGGPDRAWRRAGERPTTAGGSRRGTAARTTYYLEPARGGERGYALFREALRRNDKVAVASVVVKTRQHLAGVLVHDRVLVRDVLRYAAAVRDPSRLRVPGAALRALRISDRELKMAERLVAEMTEDWDPKQYHDEYRGELLAFSSRSAAGRPR
jgi:Ku70/Ku80-like protein